MLSTTQKPSAPNPVPGLADLITPIPMSAGAEGLRAFLQHDTVQLYHGRSADPSMRGKRSWSAMGAGLYLTSRDRASDYAECRASGDFSPILDMYTIRSREMHFYICEDGRTLSKKLVGEWGEFLKSKIDNPPPGYRGSRLYPDPKEDWNFGVRALLDISKRAEAIQPATDITELIHDAWGERLFPQFMQSKGFGGMAAFEGHDATGKAGPTFVIFDRSDPRMQLSGSHIFQPATITGSPPSVAQDPFREASFTAIERSGDGSFRAMKVGN